MRVPAVRHGSPRIAVAVALCVTLAACGRAHASWPDGTPRFEGRISALSGEREGEWTFWYPDGALREQGTYDAGTRTGTWRQWYRNGQLLSEGRRAWSATNHASEREGAWTFWHEDGSLRARGTYRHGLREGEWTFLDAEGQPDLEQGGTYHAGERAE